MKIHYSNSKIKLIEELEIATSIKISNYLNY